MEMWVKTFHSRLPWSHGMWDPPCTPPAIRDSQDGVGGGDAVPGSGMCGVHDVCGGIGYVGCRSHVGLMGCMG